MNEIRKIRDELGLTQKALALKLDVSRSELAMAERGRRQLNTEQMSKLRFVADLYENNRWIYESNIQDATRKYNSTELMQILKSQYAQLNLACTHIKMKLTRMEKDRAIAEKKIATLAEESHYSAPGPYKAAIDAKYKAVLKKFLTSQPLDQELLMEKQFLMTQMMRLIQKRMNDIEAGRVL